MQLAFRIECPACKWGQEFRNSYINKGWLQLTCRHCNKTFFTKVTITGVKIETQPEQPNGLPITKVGE